MIQSIQVSTLKIDLLMIMMIIDEYRSSGGIVE